MYPSISNNSIYSPISSSLFNIPSPSLQYEDELFFQYYYHHDHHFLQQPQPLITSDYQNHDDALAESTETAVNMEDPNKLEEEEEGCNKNKKGNGMSSKRANIPRNKRVHKKDRHSKIHTAQGPRDRRIRLSIDIARNFFNLQDMLEFNKASKTVEWLLIKSKSAIKELVHISKQSCSNNVIGGNSTSSTSSECEVVSGVDEYSPSNYHQKKKENAKGISCCKEKNKKKKLKTVRRAPAFHHPFAKESRKQARERARERTIKKNFGVAMGHDGLNLRSWSEESGRNCMNHPPNEMPAEVELISNHEKQLLGSKESIVNDCSFLFTGNWSQYSIFNYQ